MEAARALLGRYKAGTCTPGESMLIDKWLLEIHAGEKSDLTVDDFEDIQHELWRNIANLTATENPKGKRGKLWSHIALTAAAVAAVVFGVWFYASIPIVNRKSLFITQHDVAPGKNMATLSLSSGKTISLSGAHSGIVINASSLKYNDGTDVAPIESGGGLITAATPRGGQYAVTLPDGTKVWLNAASILKFPSNFTGLKERKVFLSGEAYFEVFKNKKQPFVVNSEKMELTVLGTHFNVSAYEDEGSTKATLLEGAIRINSLTINGTVGVAMLKPNQEAMLRDYSVINVRDVDGSEAIAWQKGYFLFANEDIKTIMRKVARWYNVEVEYEGNVDNMILGGTVSKFSNVSKVLAMLQETGAVKFRMEGKKVIVSR